MLSDEFPSTTPCTHFPSNGGVLLGVSLFGIGNGFDLLLVFQSYTRCHGKTPPVLAWCRWGTIGFGKQFLLNRERFCAVRLLGPCWISWWWLTRHEWPCSNHEMQALWMVFVEHKKARSSAYTVWHTTRFAKRRKRGSTLSVACII